MMYIGQLKKYLAFLTQIQNASTSEMAKLHEQSYSNTRLKVLMALLQKF